MDTASCPPVVSVIIPCYGQAMYLPEAIESVVAQGYPSWEAIIVNDGSPDDTAAVARRLIAIHGTRVRLLEQSNAGVSAARNAGIAAAAGRYVLPLDADDRIAPTMLERTVAVLEAEPRVAVVYVQVMRFGDVTEESTSGKIEYDPDVLAIWNFVGVSSLFRRDVWTACGGYQTDMVWGYEDWDFWLACAARGCRMKRVPEVLFYNRSRPGSRSTTASQHHVELMRLLASHHPQFLTPRRRAMGRIKYLTYRARWKLSRVVASVSRGGAR